MSIGLGLGLKVVLGITVAAVVTEVVVGKPSGPSQREERPSATSAVVERVIDGDTVVLDTGDHVRLIGIDAPEVGDCGAARATKALTDLVEGKRVALSNPSTVQDEDKYSRLLRYLNIHDRDVGLEMISHGLARARYDSQDGYDHHPLQSRYRAMDGATLSVCDPRKQADRRELRKARADAIGGGPDPRPDETAAELRQRTRRALADRRREHRDAIPSAPDTDDGNDGFVPPPAGRPTP